MTHRRYLIVLLAVGACAPEPDVTILTFATGWGRGEPTCGTIDEGFKSGVRRCVWPKGMDASAGDSLVVEAYPDEGTIAGWYREIQDSVDGARIVDSLATGLRQRGYEATVCYQGERAPAGVVASTRWVASGSVVQVMTTTPDSGRPKLLVMAVAPPEYVPRGLCPGLEGPPASP